MSNTPTPAPPNYAAGAAQQSGQYDAGVAQLGDAEAKLMGGSANANAFGGGVLPKLNTAIRNELAMQPNYGGYAGGANDFANYTSGLAAQARGQAAPVMNLDAANADRAQGLAALQQQQGGLSALAAQGAGGGPGATAAQAGFNVAGNQGMLAALQASGAGRGAAGQAAAQQQALAGNSAAMGNAAAQAGAARANAAMQGQAAYQQGAQGYSQGVAGLAGADWNASADQASLQEQQNSINQQASLGYLGLGQQALGAQNTAGAGMYAAEVGNATAANALAAQQTIANAGLGLGAVSAAGGIASSIDKQQSQQGGQGGTA